MKAVIITHAGPDIGGGHLSRSLALAQGSQRVGIDVSWMLNEDARGMASGLQIAGASFVDDPFADAAHSLSHVISCADLIIVDSYTCTERWFDIIRRMTDRPIIYISDGTRYIGSRRADIIIDYSFFADEKDYARSSRLADLLGPRYALIRRDLWDLESTEGKNVLLIPGASDVANVAERVISWWDEDRPALDIVLGPLVHGTRVESLRRTAAAKRNISILPSPSDLPRRMASAGCVVCSASVTMYESLSLKKRTVVFVVADNQAGAGDRLASLGIAEDLGRWQDVTKEQFCRALEFRPNTTALMDAVDPHGAINCAEAISSAITRSS